MGSSVCGFPFITSLGALAWVQPSNSQPSEIPHRWSCLLWLPVSSSFPCVVSVTHQGPAWFLQQPLPKGFPCGSTGKESACNVGKLGSIPGLGRSPGEGKGYPLQYSGLENSMDCIVHGVAKSWTRLSNFCFHKLLNAGKHHHNLAALNNEYLSSSNFCGSGV